MRIIKGRFRTADRLYVFDARDIDIKWRDRIIVEADRGMRLATAVSDVEEVPDERKDELREKFGFSMKNAENKEVRILPKVIRLMNEDDEKNQRKMEKEEKKAYYVAQKKIKKHNLNMKLVDVEFYIDRSKAIFYFVSETRVDFRALVRDLAKTFRTRIELRQIGVRDEVKVMGAIAPCGLQTCCSTFLDHFDSISVKMLRDQNIMLNPVKYSGTCGRLMCCLAYEQDTYLQLKKEFPPTGSIVSTPRGEGEVVLQDVMKGCVRVRIKDSDAEESYPLDEIEIVSTPEFKEE